MPHVGETPFAVTRSSRRTTWGRLAESPARRNRFTEKAKRTRGQKSQPTLSRATSRAMTRSKNTRIALLATRIQRRDHQSRKTPTNGPRIVKGSRIAAKAPAVGARSGENMTVEARAAWKMPSEP